MFPNGSGIWGNVRGNARKTGWHPNESDNLFKNGKSFVRCLCPKCNIQHDIYMFWTGRGMPRKYCSNCKPLVGGYDETAIHEVTVSTSAHSKKKTTPFRG